MMDGLLRGYACAVARAHVVIYGRATANLNVLTALL